MGRVLFIPLVAVFCIEWSTAAPAAVKTWANAIDGSWTEPSRWTGGVPTAVDSAVFNKAGTYTVYFSSVFQDLHDMMFSAGNVTFERLANPATLTILNGSSAGNTLTVANATLNMGGTLPVNITVGANLNIESGGTVNVKAGSFLNAGTVSLSLQFVKPGGTLTISGAGQVTSSGLGIVIGDTAGPNAIVTVTGAGSTLTEPSIQLRNAVVTIQNGGKAIGGSFDTIGYADGSSGTATISGAGSSWTNGGMIIGERGAGALHIEDSGAVATSGSGTIASDAAGAGSVTVTGAASIWTIGAGLAVGNPGAGTLTISNSGTVKVGNGAGPVSVNALSTLNIGEGGIPGVLQAGTLSNNGVLNLQHTDAAIISAAISGNGQITKSNGSGSTTLANVSAFTGPYSVQSGLLILQGNANGSDYNVAGDGTLRFSGGKVNLGISSVQVAATAAVEYESANLRGGFLRGPGAHTIIPGASSTTLYAATTFNSTSILQNGTASLVNFTNGGTFTNNAALTFNGGTNTATGVMHVNSTLDTLDVGNLGVVAVHDGGTINNSLGSFVSGGGSRTTVDFGGAINLLGGTALELNGALLVNNGTVDGTVNVNYGSLAKGTGTYGVVNVNEGGVYSPGNSPGISTAASVAFQTGAFVSGAPRLVMELGGTAVGTQYDQLQVAGTLTLNGTLEVRLFDLGAGLFAPGAGDAFDLLDFDPGNLSGEFSSIVLPTLSGALTWNTSQLYTTGILSVSASLVPGDFDSDGDVDGADFVAWQTHFPTSSGATLADGDADNDGDVDGADFVVWQTNFPFTPGPGAAPVPEPAAFMLAAFAVVGFACFRRMAVRLL